MRASYLVDTDWLIDHLNNRSEVTRKLKELRPAGVAISIISVAELYEGVYYSKNPGRSQAMLDSLLKEFTALAMDEEICKIFGQQRGRLRKEKKIVSDFDLLIASTCLRWNLTLLTNNRRHFEAVAGLRLVSVS
ncbi:MAG: type II toxin-antitoxin system VapC family toxin [Chloroflexi bacterium]|nr:type II toxin-antitoxin system VapC family toxin [Chloroflexota bacterium]